MSDTYIDLIFCHHCGQGDWYAGEQPLETLKAAVREFHRSMSDTYTDLICSPIRVARATGINIDRCLIPILISSLVVLFLSCIVWCCSWSCVCVGDLFLFLHPCGQGDWYFAFTRYCNCQYCVVYIAITGGRRETSYCAIVRAMKGWSGVPKQRTGAQE